MKMSTFLLSIDNSNSNTTIMRKTKLGNVVTDTKKHRIDEELKETSFWDERV